MSSASSAFRLLRGCRPLFSPLKSPSSSSDTAKITTAASAAAAAAAAAAAKVSQSKPKKKNNQNTKSRSSASANSSSSPKPRRELARPSGILKVAPVSPALHDFLGMPEVSRAQAVKQVWSYIKENNLQNPANRKEVQCDEKLRSIFEGRDKVGILEVGRLLFRHFNIN